MCLPAHIVIYLRALNWTSYSFGPGGPTAEWSSITAHWGMLEYEAGDALHTASCLKSAAAERMLYRTP